MKDRKDVDNKESLSSREILDGVYAKLLELSPTGEVELPRYTEKEIGLQTELIGKTKAVVEIASFGSDFHGYQTSHFSYEKAAIILVESKPWLIAKATEMRCFFPAEGAKGDIIAVEAPPNILSENRDLLPQRLLQLICDDETKHFGKSVLLASSDQIVQTASQNRLGMKFGDLIDRKELNELTVQEKQIDSEYVNVNTFSPLAEQNASYSPVLVDVLARRIVELLSSKMMTKEECHKYVLASMRQNALS